MVFCINLTKNNQCQGFHGGGGDGLLGYIGGTAEKIVFLSTPIPPLEVRDTSAATRPAFPATVGSVQLQLDRLSLNLSKRSGPPTMAPVTVLGLGVGASRHRHPPLHEYLVLSLGMEAPRWWTCLGYLDPYPTTQLIFNGLSPRMYFILFFLIYSKEKQKLKWVKYT